MTLKSEEEYLANNGWSSHHFLEHAKYLFPRLKEAGYTVEIHRTVIYIKKYGMCVKVYVHHKGRTRERITFTNERGMEIDSYNKSYPPEAMLDNIREWFGDEAV